MTASYNEMLSTTFSRQIRNNIMTEKNDPDIIVYHDIFPNVSVKHGEASAGHWVLEGEYSSYLATSPNGSATGYGSSIQIWDDLVKSAEESMNEVSLDKIWNWLCQTMISRLESNGKIACIMTSWSSNDPSRKLLDFCKTENIPYKHILMKAKDENGKLLCSELLDEKTYNIKRALIGERIFEANFNQKCIDMEGRLLQKFQTYDIAPCFEGIYAYVDCADSGSDYLCAIIFGLYKQEAYIIDILYDQRPMSVTEPLLAKMLYDNRVNLATFERNGGGGFFCKTIEKTLKEEYYSNQTKITSFHQSKNKEARIMSNSLWIQEHIYYPSDWRKRWPEFYKDTTNFIVGESAHDDNLDSLTGISEFVNSFNRQKYSDSLYQKGHNVVNLNNYTDPYYNGYRHRYTETIF